MKKLLFTLSLVLGLTAGVKSQVVSVRVNDTHVNNILKHQKVLVYVGTASTLEYKTKLVTYYKSRGYHFIGNMKTIENGQRVTLLSFNRVFNIKGN